MVLIVSRSFAGAFHRTKRYVYVSIERRGVLSFEEHVRSTDGSRKTLKVLGSSNVSKICASYDNLALSRVAMYVQVLVDLMCKQGGGITYTRNPARFT